MTVKYYYISMSQIDMLQNQVLEEILRERANYYLAKNRAFDFWVLLSPKFMDQDNIKNKLLKTNFYSQHKNEISDNLSSEFYSCLITLDKDFIKWIKLRLGYFEDIDNLSLLKNDKLNNNSYISDGIYGELLIDNKDSSLSPLNYDKNFVNPKIISNKFEKTIEVYYSNKV